MNKLKRIFFKSPYDNASQRGGMLVELLMSISLAAIALPFIFQYQQRAVRRAENIAVSAQMQSVQSALEKYIVQNRERLLATVGKGITRVSFDELDEFGLPGDVNTEHYQLRVLKSADNQGRSTLQGVVIMTGPDITPLRTREIVALGDNQIGFIDGNSVYGAFNAWHTDLAELGAGVRQGIVATTSVNRDNALYLWRVPSNSALDATMMSSLNLGGHDIVDAEFVNADGAVFEETLSSLAIASRNSIFSNKTSIRNNFTTTTATVSGALTSDGRNMEVFGGFYLADTGKFSSFTTGDLWATKLTLGGFSIGEDVDVAILRVNNALDLTYGSINAIYVTVGLTGSVTPRLVISDRITDSVNSNFYWDATSGNANLMDLSLAELSRMAPMVLRLDSGRNGATSRQLFSAVTANKNATASDYMNAITQIQNRVRAKYRLLNLE